MNRQRRLGRGLEALLAHGPLEQADADGNPVPEAHQQQQQQDQPASTLQQKIHQEKEQPAPYSAGPAVEGMMWVGVYEIDRNPFQPRKHFDEAELAQLAASITEHGLLQPVVLRRVGDRYQLISGERRWRAATTAGWDKIPCRIQQADDRQMAELAIVENVQRKDLSPLEKAASFNRYIEQYGCTREEFAQRLNIDRSTVSNLIRLLELPEAVQDALHKEEISQGHARALLPLGDERQQVEFCRQIVNDGLSVRATEQLVRATIDLADVEPLSVVGSEPEGESDPAQRTRTELLASLEQIFRSGLGTKVDIRQSSSGKGRIVVHFTSNDEFERIKEQMLQSDSQVQAHAG